MRSLIICFVIITALFQTVPTTSLWAQNQSGITSPANGDAVSGDVIISGTAVIEPFLRYELYYKQDPSGDDAYIYFDGGTNQVVNGQLGIWRTTDLPAGTYSIRLRVVKADGNYGEFVISNLSLNLNIEPTATPTSSEPTPTPIPSATFTPAPQPTPNVGQVTQPDLPGQPTATPALVLAPTPAPQGDDAAGESNGDEESFTFEEGTASGTGATESSSFTRQLGEAVALDRLRSYFITGIQFSAMLILGVVVLLAGKRIFAWVWTQYR